MTVAQLDDVTKIYTMGKTKIHAVQEVSLQIESGEFTSIAGPSGSGKTTLLNMIGCLDTPTEGNIKIADIEISQLSSNELADLRKEHIGFIFQTFNLIPVLTALENVEFPLILMGKKNKKERLDKASQILEEVGLGDYLDHRPNELSGGQQQRVSIARALVKQPKLILADEPTANIDSKTGEEVLEIMKAMNENHGTTFIFSTHDRLVMHYAKRLIHLRDGKITDDEVKSNTKTEEE